MGKIKDFFKHTNVARRSFLKLAGLSVAGIGLGLPFSPKKGSASIFPSNGQIKEHRNIWKIDDKGNRYFVPRNIRTDKVNSEGKVIARVDGWWRWYQVREFDNEFLQFWLAEKTGITISSLLSLPVNPIRCKSRTAATIIPCLQPMV